MNPDRHRRVLVTGGTGFVGANLVRRLLDDGHQVTMLVRQNSDHWRNRTTLGSKVLVASLTHSDLPAILWRLGPDWIFHLAQHGGYPWQQADDAEIRATNYDSTVNLLEAAIPLGFEAFINTGTSTEYGPKDHPPAEDEFLDPKSMYALTKAMATIHCAARQRETGAHISTLRLYSVYGPWEDPRRFIPQLVAHCLEGKLPPLANPANAHDYIHVDDVVDAYLQAAVAPPGIYNVGTGIQTTLAEIIALAREVFGLLLVEPQWGSLPDRNWDTTVWVADSSRLAREARWQPRITLQDGLRSMAGWLAANPGLLYGRYRADRMSARRTASSMPAALKPIKSSK